MFNEADEINNEDLEAAADFYDALVEQNRQEDLEAARIEAGRQMTRMMVERE